MVQVSLESISLIFGKHSKFKIIQIWTFKLLISEYETISRILNFMNFSMAKKSARVECSSYHVDLETANSAKVSESRARECTLSDCKTISSLYSDANNLTSMMLCTSKEWILFLGKLTTYNSYF